MMLVIFYETWPSSQFWCERKCLSYGQNCGELVGSFLVGSVFWFINLVSEVVLTEWQPPDLTDGVISYFSYIFDAYNLQLVAHRHRSKRDSHNPGDKYQDFGNKILGTLFIRVWQALLKIIYISAILDSITGEDGLCYGNSWAYVNFCLGVAA